MTVDVELVPSLVDPVTALNLGYCGGTPAGLLVVCVIPEVDQTVPLHGGECREPGLVPDDGGGVGDLDTLASVAAVLPVVEGTLDAVSLHPPTHGNVCPEVNTVGRHHEDLAGLSPEDGHVEAQGVHLPHLAAAEVAALQQDEPTVGETRRDPANLLQPPGPVDGRRSQLAGAQVTETNVRELRGKQRLEWWEPARQPARRDDSHLSLCPSGRATASSCRQ